MEANVALARSAITDPKSAISCDGDCTDAKTDADPAQNTGDEHLYYCQDANFNVTALVDDYDGAVVERYMYSPYGQPEVLHGVRDSSGTDTSASEWSERTSNTFENALLYCGYYHDWETGLYHVRRRYYHPRLGRFLTRDPIGYADGMNLYGYCGSAPAARRSVGAAPAAPSRSPGMHNPCTIGRVSEVIQDLECGVRAPGKHGWPGAPGTPLLFGRGGRHFCLAAPTRLPHSLQ